MSHDPIKHLTDRAKQQKADIARVNGHRSKKYGYIGIDMASEKDYSVAVIRDDYGRKQSGVRFIESPHLAGKTADLMIVDEVSIWPAGLATGFHDDFNFRRGRKTALLLLL